MPSYRQTLAAFTSSLRLRGHVTVIILMEIYVFVSRAFCRGALFICGLLALIYSDILLLHFVVGVYELRIATIHAPSEQSPEATEISASVFRTRWTAFLSGLINEWQLVGVMCGLLLAVIGILAQIVNITGDPLVYTTFMVALIDTSFSLFCAMAYGMHAHGFTFGIHGRPWLENYGILSASKWRKPSQLLAAPVAWLMWAMFSLFALFLIYVWDKPLLSGSASSSHTPSLVSSDIYVLSSRQSWIGSAMVLTTVIVVGFGHLFFATYNLVKLGSAPLIAEGEVGADERRGQSTPDHAAV